VTADKRQIHSPVRVDPQWKHATLQN